MSDQILSEVEKAAARRLKSIWDSKRKVLKLTQQNFADTQGWNQSNVSHYLLGRAPLNRSAVLLFATALKVDPKTIYPEIFENLLLSPTNPDDEFMDLWEQCSPPQREALKLMMKTFLSQK